MFRRRGIEENKMSDTEMYTPADGLSILKYVTIPKFNGSFTPSIHTWKKQVDKIMEHVGIPYCMQGAFIMKYLEGASLEIVKNDLSLGNFLPDKEVVFEILMQNFGNKFFALKEIIRQHKDLGTIASCYSCPDSEESLQWWSSLNQKCTKHLQLIITAEESLFGASETPPEEYIMTLRGILPMDILLRKGLSSMEFKMIFPTIKSSINELKRVSLQCIIEESVLQSKKNNDLKESRKDAHTVSKSALTTCRICKIISSNHGKQSQPREHKISREGFIIKESCPELAGLSKSEKIGILKKNGICRSCLCLGTQTPLHPGNNCEYLKQKNLLFLKCSADGCRLRATLCDKHVCHPHKYLTDPVDCVPQPGGQQCTIDAVDMNTRETVGPVGIMKNAKKIVKEKTRSTQEKSFECEEMGSNNSNTFKKRQYRSLSICTNLVQALRILVFIFCYLVTSVKKMKREFYKSEKILKKQSSEVIGLQNLDSQINRSEFDPG